MVPRHPADSERATYDVGFSSSQRTAISARTPPLYEGHIFQMLTDRKEQQAWSDRDREQVALNCENVMHEQEVLKQLNDQLQAQVTALQNTQAQM